MATPTNAASGSGYIFLSHSGADTQASRQFAEVIRRNGFEVWFDTDNLQPGDNWMGAIEDAISRASGMIVYIGQLGIQTWVDREVRLGLVRNTRDREAFCFIPVLGEGSNIAALPPFVQQHQWVDLRDRRRDAEQIGRLLAVLRKSSPSVAAIPPDYWSRHSPFRGLQVFSPEDSWLFFGRDGDTSELLTRLGRTSTLVVIGNSGSGKSSLIHAGLVPALCRGRFHFGGHPVESWRIAAFRPSAAPFDYLAESLPAQLVPGMSEVSRAEFTKYCKTELPRGGEALRNAIIGLVGPGGKASTAPHVLLVADQFEELFTLVEDRNVRTRYIECLLAAARLDAAVPVHLVLGLRADFYARCLEHPNLSAALQTNLYNVPGIGPRELREAIENRLALASASAESGLIDSLLADVGAEPGNLALLEHALTQLWERSDASNRMLTNETYTAIGRLRGALGKHADAVYSVLPAADQLLAQKIFLDLVQLGEEARDTRRRVAKQELLQLAAPERVERVIASLADERLLTTSGNGAQSPGENFVEVSHEALIREWPTLREWLKDNREELRLSGRLRQAAEEWVGLMKDTGALLQGTRLAQAREWLGRHPEANTLVREFLDASGATEENAVRKERQAQERETAHQKELLEAETAATVQARNAASRTRKLVYALGALVLIAMAAAWIAHQQQLTAQSRELAAQAEALVSLGERGEALDRAINAFGIAATAEAQEAIAHSFAQGLTELKGHSFGVRSAAFSPDGQRVVTASNDKTARVWDAATGQVIAKLEGHSGAVGSAAFSPDGQRVVTASIDKTARVWDAATGQMIAKLEGHSDDVLSAAFSPDGQRVVTASIDKTARVWNAAGEVIAKLEGHSGEVKSAAFSPDGQRVLTASRDQTARLWNAATGEVIAKLEGHSDFVLRAAFSPDGRRVVTAGYDKTARVWNAATGQVLAKLEGHSGEVNSAAFSPDGQHVVTASDDKRALVWNTVTARVIAKLEGAAGLTSSAVFSRDGHRVVTVGGDSTARVWNAATGQVITKLEGHSDVDSAAFSPDGQRVLTASFDQTARVWNATTGQVVAKQEGLPGAGFFHGFGSPAFSPDGQRVVTVSTDKTARVLNAATGQVLVKLEGHSGEVLSAAFSPDGQRVVTASADQTARVWNAATGQVLAKLEGHSGAVGSAAFSPDGQRVVTASTDHTARVWNATTGQVLAKLEGHSGFVLSAAFSPDGQRVLTTGRDQTARVWNAATGQVVAKQEGLTGSFRGLDIAAFSPDGQRVVTAGNDQMARVWNAATGQVIAKLEGHSYEISSVAFSPDGQRIVAAWEGGITLIFKVVTLDEIVRLLASK